MSNHYIPPKASVAYTIVDATPTDLAGGYLHMIARGERGSPAGVLYTTRLSTNDVAITDLLIPGATLKIEVVAPDADDCAEESAW